MERRYICLDTERPTQKVKMKISGTHTMTGIQMKGPAADDDVAIVAGTPMDVNHLLQNVIIHKGKKSILPIQLPESSQNTSSVSAKQVDFDIEGVNTPVNIIGININTKKKLCTPAALHGVLNRKDNPLAVWKTKGLKRKCPSNEKPTTNIQGGIKEKDIMRMTDNFNKRLESSESQDFCNTVIMDEKELDKEDMDNLSMNLKRKISSGSFGKVFELESKKGTKIVVKEIVNGKVDPNEILIPYGLQQQGLVKVLGAKCVPGHFWILMEFAGSSLRHWVGCQRFTEYLKVNQVEFCLSLYKIVSWMENHWIVHRDIKPENICISYKEKFVPTLIDFGSAQATKDKPCWSAHTIEFLSPALNQLVYEKKRLGEAAPPLGNEFMEEKSDCYSMSMVILWMLQQGCHPINLVNKYNYNDPEVLNAQRMKVLTIMINLQDSVLEPFVRKFQEPIQTVLKESLRVDASVRWKGSKGCSYIEKAQEVAKCKKSRMSDDEDQDDLDDFFTSMLIAKPSNPVVKVAPHTAVEMTQADTNVGNLGMLNVRPKGNGSPCPNHAAPQNAPKSRTHNHHLVKLPGHQQTPNTPGPQNALKPRLHQHLINHILQKTPNPLGPQQTPNPLGPQNALKNRVHQHLVNHFAVQQTPNPLGLQEIPNPLRPQQTPNPLGPQQTPNPLRPQQIPNLLGPQQIPNPLRPQQTPNPLGPRQTPNPLGLQQTPNPLGPQQTPNPLGPQQTPNPLGPRQTPNPLGPQQTPNPLGLQQIPNPLGLQQTAIPRGLEQNLDFKAPLNIPDLGLLDMSDSNGVSRRGRVTTSDRLLPVTQQNVKEPEALMGGIPHWHMLEKETEAGQKYKRRVNKRKSK